MQEGNRSSIQDSSYLGSFYHEFCQEANRHHEYKTEKNVTDIFRVNTLSISFKMDGFAPTVYNYAEHTETTNYGLGECTPDTKS
jgi:hypothetical protein